MKILTSNELNAINHPTAVAIGRFDGLHIGHRAVIAAAVDFARENSLKSVVYKIAGANSICPRTDMEIRPYDETIEILRSWGVGALAPQPMNDKFKNLSCEEFVEEYLHRRLCAKLVSVGYNFRFGKNAAGDAERLREICGKFGIKVNITPPVCVDGEAVSSTKIREFLKNGELEKAARYLGR